MQGSLRYRENRISIIFFGICHDLGASAKFKCYAVWEEASYTGVDHRRREGGKGGNRSGARAPMGPVIK